jgi:5-methylthioadenosine/S-adenosylhomocysteine deaminase
MPTAIDLLIEPGWIIPIEPAGAVLEGHALAVDKGRIVALLPASQATDLYAAREHVRLPGQVLLPGFVNLHTHAAMSLLRGYADDLPLMRWLEERIWPAERQYASPEFVRDGTLLAAWEMLRGGVTCFNDMYYYPGAAAEAARQAGIRAVLGVTVIEFPTAYATDAGDYLAKGLAVRDAWRDEPLVSFALAPHAPYTVSDRTFEQVATLAAQLDMAIHIHLHETRAEVEDSIKQYGSRPVERLHQLGLLGPNLIAVHAVHLNSNEISQLADNGSFISHCPTSNMKLGSGIAPVAELLAAGLRIGLGTDGAASNNRLDILQEMRLAALLAKATSGDATTIPAHQALRMATLDGAAALGLAESIGSLVPGKWADLCAIRVDDWPSQPCYCAASHLVYVAGREQVSHVWVAGVLKICDSLPVGIAPTELIDISKSWHNPLRLR